MFTMRKNQVSGGERLVTNLLLMPQHGAGYNIGTLITLAPTEDRQGPQEVFMLCLLGRLIRFLLVVVGVLVATGAGRGSDGSPADFAEDERLLKDAKIATDEPGLLEFIRQ